MNAGSHAPTSSSRSGGATFQSRSSLISRSGAERRFASGKPSRAWKASSCSRRWRGAGGSDELVRTKSECDPPSRSGPIAPFGCAPNHRHSSAVTRAPAFPGERIHPSGRLRPAAPAGHRSLRLLGSPAGRHPCPYPFSPNPGAPN
jgi:hypothetical protein